MQFKNQQVEIPVQLILPSPMYPALQLQLKPREKGIQSAFS